MDFLIKFNESEYLRLPVAPPDFAVQMGNQSQSVNITDIGEMVLWGQEKLAGIAIESFFPFEYSPLYCSYAGFPKPWDCVDRLNKWRNSGSTVRLVITDRNKSVDINMEVLIETLDVKMQDSTGDVYYTLALRQYKRISTPQQAGNITVAEPMRPAPPSVPAPAAAAVRHTVKSGETLWVIAKKYYGVGSKYPLIVTANAIKDPNRISAGMSLLIP